MNQFTVPQFIEHEPKIVGPLTFKQFIYIGIAAGISFVFYFTVSFSIFILATIVVMSIGAALAFFKSGGRTLPIMLKNLFSFSVAPKIYLWKQKQMLPPKIMKNAPTAEKTEQSSVPTAAGKSRLNALSSQIETSRGEQENAH